MPLQFETVFGMALVAGGLTIALFGLRHVWRAGAVRRAPRAGAPGAADATMVRLEGTVEVSRDGETVAESGAGETVAAPFSGTESVVVRHAVEERQLNPGAWILSWDVTIEEGVASVPFDVRTPDATATVDGAIGTAILGSETVARVGAGDPLPDRIAAFHEESVLTTEPLIFGSLPGPLARVGRLAGLGKRIYSEERLEPGDGVTVIGYPVGGPGDNAAGGPTVDPLVVSDRSPRRAFLSMARTGLVAILLSVPVVALGLVVLLV